MIQFTAATVQCSEAIDWEIVQVNFDTMDTTFDEENRTTPYLLISANFEFSERVQIEYHDGKDYAGDSLNRIDLWRNKVFAVSGRGCEFDVVGSDERGHLPALRGYNGSSARNTTETTKKIPLARKSETIIRFKKFQFLQRFEKPASIMVYREPRMKKVGGITRF